MPIYLQSSSQLTSETNDTITLQEDWRGPYTELAPLKPVRGATYTGLADANRKLALPDGTWLVTYANLRGEVGALATLTIKCQLSESSGSEGGEEDPEDTATYEVKMCQASLPLTRYCAANPTPSSTEYGHLAYLNSWLQEPDAALKGSYSTRYNTLGMIIGLEGRTLELAMLYASGVEYVLRYYPIITRTTNSSKDAPQVGALCSCIDTPPTKGLAMVSGTWQWLKIQDDITLDADGSWTRTEAWQGADDWVDGLYSADSATRWKFGTSLTASA